MLNLKKKNETGKADPVSLTWVIVIAIKREIESREGVKNENSFSATSCSSGDVTTSLLSLLLAVAHSSYSFWKSRGGSFFAAYCFFCESFQTVHSPQRHFLYYSFFFSVRTISHWNWAALSNKLHWVMSVSQLKSAVTQENSPRRVCKTLTEWNGSQTLFPFLIVNFPLRTFGVTKRTIPFNRSKRVSPHKAA